MSIAFGISWDDAKGGRVMRAFVAVLVAVAVLPALAADPAALSRAVDQMVGVIVRELPGAGSAPERAVEDLGGTVEREIGIIDGFSATVPADEVSSLGRSAGVGTVTPDVELRPMHAVEGYDPNQDMGSVHNTSKLIRAHDLWKAGISGKGVDVALIDTGVVPVNGLTTPGKVINGPDLSFESQADNLRYLDTYGHGTHMAGIIAGRDDAVSSARDLANHDSFVGIAPDSRIVNVKVADANGVTDVSQVIAAIDWVVQHRNDNGMNIRVLNLSFGTDGVQDYVLDPLTFAAEVAWHKGIVVVVAAGNSGYGSKQLNNPAYDPYVIAVGAEDPRGTGSTSDDVVPEWSSRGNGVRNPDFVAPGKSIVSLRDPGSQLDLTHPEGYVNSRFFKGSGTSQAAAVASGAAALLLQQRPGLTPDQVKALLISTAKPLPNTDPVAQGAGLINVKDAAGRPTPTAVQTWPKATGLGSLDAARGTAHPVSPDGVVLEGEQDIFGQAWDPATWSATSLLGSSWSGGLWNGSSWSGSSWSGSSWSGSSWSGSSWSGSSWSGSSWSGSSWSGSSWSGSSWSGSSWSGSSWSGSSWSGSSWSGSSWSGSSWSGAGWAGAGWTGASWG